MSIKEIIDQFYNEKYYEYSRPTYLCNLMDNYGSDKGPNFKNCGNYSKFYDFIFNGIRDNIKNLFEVGIGTNNLDVPSTMGADGVPGASLRAWRDYFPNASIVGADVDKRILFSENRIETYYVDQYNNDTINELWNKFNSVLFDVIIDDGIHDTYSENSGNVNFFENSLHMLKSGGFYIIEDVAINFNGDDVSRQVINFLNNVNSGSYGNDLEGELVKVPAYYNDKSKPTHNTQIILIRKK